MKYYIQISLLVAQPTSRFGPVLWYDNIGKLLAIVHGLAIDFDMPIYSDSVNAMQLDQAEEMQNKAYP